MSFGVQIDVLLAGVTNPTTDLPLSGGKVYFYEPGTTTPKAAYTDQTLLSAASNPATLDTEGRLLLFAQGDYRIVVRDSAGVTQLYDWDDLQFFSEITQTVSTYTPTTTDMTSVTWTKSAYHRSAQGNLITVMLIGSFRGTIPTGSGTTVTLPVAPHADVLSIRVPVTTIKNGGSVALDYATVSNISASVFALVFTSGWGTASANNSINVMFTYPAA